LVHEGVMFFIGMLVFLSDSLSVLPAIFTKNRFSYSLAIAYIIYQVWHDDRTSSGEKFKVSITDPRARGGQQ